MDEVLRDVVLAYAEDGGVTDVPELFMAWGRDE